MTWSLAGGSRDVLRGPPTAACCPAGGKSAVAPRLTWARTGPRGKGWREGGRGQAIGDNGRCRGLVVLWGRGRRRAGRNAKVGSSSGRRPDRGPNRAAVLSVDAAAAAAAAGGGGGGTVLAMWEVDLAPLGADEKARQRFEPDCGLSHLRLPLPLLLPLPLPLLMSARG
ncbi:hypothetical protein PLESTB_000850100 [Pleodorina starrii]|uniref:Uncharacterized protein n=1 Tax=Pleodorina starrii TaxID=330485 RepID=A0A9W6F2L5_9CHLO|nr:hypothetical protein PLESTM_001443200 [Pleodorina starrii]GLC54313.1 hypothetical protein PLESTB_000850100 [Pleodorina starrii]GLC71964.1 hypothetical protein PLESTF_001189700 [Pleodorina starrii]